MASFRCYDNSDVIATLIMTNFHLYLIQLWWQFFQMFVYGDVVYAQTWQVLTLKTVSSHFHMPVRPLLLHRMALVSFRLFCKNLCNLPEFFGQMVYRPHGRKLPVRLCCFFAVIIKNTLLMVYYELQSISFADWICRPVIDQLEYYIVLIFYQIRKIDQPAYHQSVICRLKSIIYP